MEHRLQCGSAGLSVVCYANNTLIMAHGVDWRRTIRLAENDAQLVVGRIHALELEVAPNIIEAMWFHVGLGESRPNPG